MLETIKTLTALSEEYVELTLRHDPVGATSAGIHDYDGQYPNDSPEGFRERARWLSDLDQRLVASVPWEELPTEQRVDYALLRSAIASRRAELEEIRTHTRNPALYSQTALHGIFLLLARPFAPLEERKEAILSRLMSIGEYLESTRRNLLRVPAEFRDLALQVNSSGLAFVDEVVRTLVRSFPGEAERIEHAGERARVGILRHQEFLEGELAGKVGGTFAIGERWMNFKLEREHLLSMDCAFLETLGREHMELARRALEAEAKRLDGSKPWREQLWESKRRHPDPLRVRDAYSAEMERARRFVVDRKLAPAGECRLEIVDTPVYERVTTPIASYLPPAPFDVEQVGTFFVTPIDLSRKREDVDAQAQSHNYSSITLTSLHEAWPGHHLQEGVASRLGSRLRRLSRSTLLSEGWALYCEEMMFEQGFFLEPHTRLVQLRDLLWRACRVVIDVGLQCGRMTTAQAVDHLVQNAALDRGSAESEVRRYITMPTEPLSYLVGKMLLLELREEAQKKAGPRFVLHDFHDAVLRSGSIPPFLVREELWERLGIQV